VALNEGREDTLIVVGVDNRTAQAWWNRGWAKDEKSEARRECLVARIRASRCRARAVRIPGEDMPADEPSRGKPREEGKCRKAQAYLEEEVRHWREASRVM